MAARRAVLRQTCQIVGKPVAQACFGENAQCRLQFSAIADTRFDIAEPGGFPADIGGLQAAKPRDCFGKLYNACADAGCDIIDFSAMPGCFHRMPQDAHDIADIDEVSRLLSVAENPDRLPLAKPIGKDGQAWL